MSSHEENNGDLLTFVQSALGLLNSYSDQGRPIYTSTTVPGGLPSGGISQTPVSRRRESKASIEAMPKVTVAHEEAGNECSICLNGLKIGDEVKETPCKHRFHGACIGRWMAMSTRCPLCRFSLPAESQDINSYHFTGELDASPVNYLELDAILFGP